MISSSKILHQISWPILKKNKDICISEGPYSFGVLYATKEDLPDIDAKYFSKILNNKIKPSYFKSYASDSFPVVVSVAHNSPAFKSNLKEGDVVLKINDISVINFRENLKKVYSLVF